MPHTTIQPTSPWVRDFVQALERVEASSGRGEAPQALRRKLAELDSLSIATPEQAAAARKLLGELADVVRSFADSHAVSDPALSRSIATGLAAAVQDVAGAHAPERRGLAKELFDFLYSLEGNDEFGPKVTVDAAERRRLRHLPALLRFGKPELLSAVRVDGDRLYHDDRIGYSTLRRAGPRVQIRFDSVRRNLLEAVEALEPEAFSARRPTPGCVAVPLSHDGAPRRVTLYVNQDDRTWVGVAAAGQPEKFVLIQSLAAP